MVDVTLYVEGGGDSDALHRRCREGFRTFLEKAGFRGHMPRIVACGGRQSAFDMFRTACASNATAILLIDSEDRVQGTSSWEHLARRPEDGFTAPANAAGDQCCLMVVCMESWFLADKDALSGFFGQGFKRDALPQNENIEAVSREDVYSGLRNASAHCKTKAPYGKGEHSFRILKLIAPEKVREASPWARRFFETLSKYMER
jgi:hypothetical protein